MNRKKNIVAVSGDTAGAGAVVYWMLSGGTKHDKLSEAWQNAGYDVGMVPDPPDPPKACLRAVNEFRKDSTVSNRRTLRRPLGGRRGHALVREHADDRDLDYAVRLRAEVNVLGRIEVEVDAEGLSDYEAARLADIKEGVEKAYDRHLFSELSTHDISSWLSGKLIGRCDGVALHPSGHFYFVPPEHLDEWERMTNAIASVSGHSFYAIDAMDTERGVEGIIAAVLDEARTKAERMWNEIAKGDAGEEALSNRAAEADVIKAKLERYEDRLGIALDEIKGSMELLKANLAAAAIKAADEQPYSDLADLCDL